MHPKPVSFYKLVTIAAPAGTQVQGISDVMTPGNNVNVREFGFQVVAGSVGIRVNRGIGQGNNVQDYDMSLSATDTKVPVQYLGPFQPMTFQFTNLGATVARVYIFCNGEENTGK